MKILRLNWGEVRGETATWIPDSGRLFALWPSPVDHDLCFKAAGFRDFADSDEAWHGDFAQLVQLTLQAMQYLGAANLVAGEYVTKDKPGETALIDALLAAALDDGFPPCRLTFGGPGVAFLRSGHGLPVLWLWLATGDAEEILKAVACGRPLSRMDLAWANLF